MKSIIAVFFLFLITNETSTACLSASQNRVFPIGIVKDTIVVFETHLSRSINNKENKDKLDLSPHWRGETYLKKYSKNNELLSSVVIDSLKLFSETKYKEVVKKSFNQSFNKAISECDLELFEPVSLSFCDFQNKCNSLSINVDKVKKELYIRFNKVKSRYPVTVLKDSTSVASNIVRRNSAFSESFNVSSSFLDISSIRKYKAGNKTLTIVHLGYGQRMESADGKKSYPEGIEYKPKFDFSKPKNNIFIEPVMHHGNGFDFMIFE